MECFEFLVATKWQSARCTSPPSQMVTVPKIDTRLPLLADGGRITEAPCSWCSGAILRGCSSDGGDFPASKSETGRV